MKGVFIAAIAALAFAIPAIAQAPRQELAIEVVDQLLPNGFYRRMMEGSIDQMMDQVMASMLDMTPEEMFVLTDDMTPEQRAAVEGMTMRELAAREDPYFEERMEITFDVIMPEIISIVEAAEPDMKQAISAAYADRFTEPELREILDFTTTPTGAKFAREYLMVFTSPEVMQAMQSFVPQMMQAMPAITRKIEAATAHLPPPPGKDEAQ